MRRTYQVRHIYQDSGPFLILRATVLDHLAKGNGRLILSFFFDFSDTKKQTLDGTPRSLAFQLYQIGAGSASLLAA